MILIFNGIFPCFLGFVGGKIPRALQEMREEMQRRGVGGERVAALADQARRGLLAVPCDIRHEPAMIPDAINRIQACLPPVSPYETLERAREDLNTAALQYQEQDAWSDALDSTQSSLGISQQLLAAEL